MQSVEQFAGFGEVVPGPPEAIHRPPLHKNAWAGELSLLSFLSARCWLPGKAGWVGSEQNTRATGGSRKEGVVCGTRRQPLLTVPPEATSAHRA